MIYNFIKKNKMKESENIERIFNDGIIDLKKLRVKADYKNIPINYKLSNESLNLSNSIQIILKKYL